MRRPGLWVANGRPDHPELMLSWRPGALTSFFDYLAVNNVFAYKAAQPEAPIVIRFQHPQNWLEDPVGSARRQGQLVASKWNEIRVLDPYVYFANELNLHYESGDSNPANQPLFETPEFYQQYANWVRMTADTIKNLTPEMKLVTPPFAFGHNEDGAPDDQGQPTLGWAGYDYLYETIRQYFNNIVTFHAYWGHAGGSVRDWLYDPEQSSWYAFRWRRVLKLFETRYNIKARIIIDEAGNFSASDADFTDQIIYHATRCLQDARVIAVTYFLWQDPTYHPGNLPNSWVQQVRDLAGHVARLAAMPDVEITATDGQKPPERTIRVLFPGGQVQVMALEEYLRAVVPAEMPALWPIEAVKAQAVASRSYAEYAIAFPRHPNADICTIPGHCQNYDPARVHVRSDTAIRDTANLVALYNGQVINALYSANCGGHTLNNEAVFQGKAAPYLRGVPCPAPGEIRGHRVGLCQYGARSLAEAGQPFNNIIRHYYTGVTVGPPGAGLTSTIRGVVVDHLGQPVANVRVVLAGPGQSAETVTGPDGAYRFSNAPAGTYTLSLPDYQVRQENITPTPGEDTVVNLTLPDLATAPITVEIQRGPGLPLIVGDWGAPGVRVTIKPPSGPEMRAVTGSKPEYGPGGFETYATQAGVYVLEIEGYRFEIPMSGQFTRLTFRRAPAPQPAGVIEGTLVDHLDRPVASRTILLTGEGISLAAATDEQGRFLFENLPAGAYTVTVPDSPLGQAVTLTGQNQVSVSLRLPEPPPAGEWRVDIQRGAGLPLLVGDIGEAGAPINILNPKGFEMRITSGSKPEFGAGGFEIYAPDVGDYTLQFLDQTFVIPMNGQFTRVTFSRTTVPEVEARLVSAWMPLSRAETVLYSGLENDPDTRGLFSIEQRPPS